MLKQNTAITARRCSTAITLVLRRPNTHISDALPSVSKEPIKIFAGESFNLSCVREVLLIENAAGPRN